MSLQIAVNSLSNVGNPALQAYQNYIDEDICANENIAFQKGVHVRCVEKWFMAKYSQALKPSYIQMIVCTSLNSCCYWRGSGCGCMVTQKA